MSQQEVISESEGLQKSSCPQCGKAFNVHGRFVDHLFASKECMRKYWSNIEADRARRYGHKSQQTSQ